MAAAKKKTVAKKAAKKSPAKKPSAKKPKHRSLATLKLPRTSLMAQLGSGRGDGQKFPPRLQSMLDRSDIRNIVCLLARGIDRVDENILRSVMHNDATIDLGPGIFQGTGNDYVQWVMGVLHGVRESHHMIGNMTAELEGDTALVESYYHAHFRIEKPIGREDVFMGGRYLDRFERRPDGPGGVWKIMHRKQIIDWVRTEAVSDIFYHQNPDALWSYRTKTDPSYLMAQFPGSQSRGKLPAFLGRRYETKSLRF